MDFQSKSIVLSYPKATTTSQRDTSPPVEGAFEYLFQMRLSQMSTRIVINKLPEDTGVKSEDTEMENCLGKAKFTSPEGFEGTWAQHTQRGRAICPAS
jgi:hypothetical protein